MLRYLILIGALAAMPLSSFAAVESVDKGVVESAANVEQGKTEGPVWVVEATKSSPSQGPVWVVIKAKDAKTVS
ncbi:MAG: hypothetical protein M3Q00_00605 [Pseudomonadota bacterium]|nr:hypothetical protein [Pseudomonadota bacterium]